MRTTGTLIQTPLDDLSERITVIYFETARNNRGDIINMTEKERCRVWAKVLAINAESKAGVPEQRNRITYRVVIRYRKDIKPDDEILWNNSRLKITKPPFDVESRKIFTIFECEEVIENVK